MEFIWEQKKAGRAKETIRCRVQSLKQVARQCDILNPEAVKGFLMNVGWCNKTKVKFVDTYTAFLNHRRMSWIPPHYIPVSKLPFIPTEEDIHILISACGKTTSTALQMLKETGMRIGGLCRLKWTDLVLENKTITVSLPEKGGNPRTLGISDKPIGMLNALPRNHGENIFQSDSRYLRDYSARNERRQLRKKITCDFCKSVFIRFDIGKVRRFIMIRET